MTPMTDPCCADFALSRRRLLGSAVVLAGATTVLGSAVLTASPASATSARSVLVVLSLRGAADGMSLVVPHGDPVYYAGRPTIAIPAARLLAPDAMFGLHPSLAPLLPLWTSGRMAAIHATGLPSANRSHFSAMAELEDAAPGSDLRAGWLNRLVGTTSGSSPLQAFELGNGVVPRSLVGPQPVMSGQDIASLTIAGSDEPGRTRSLHTMYDDDDGPLGTGMRDTFNAIGRLGPARQAASHPGRYPDSDLGKALAAAAQVIRGDVGVEVVTVDQGKWDMHSDLGTLDGGRMKENATELATSLAAFFGDLGAQAGKVTLVALTEFGRRVVENSSAGLDHGYGGAMLVLGAGVRGGRYYGRWPGLADDLDADLPVTTDYRDVLADVVSARFGISTSTVFPGFTRTPVGLMG